MRNKRIFKRRVSLIITSVLLLVIAGFTIASILDVSFASGFTMSSLVSFIR